MLSTPSYANATVWSGCKVSSSGYLVILETGRTDLHYLERDPIPPVGLNRYQHGQDTWSNTCPTQVERSGIWAKLDTMQGQRCAYCEALMSETNRHIEHFRQRGRYPQGTFDWSNLFGSCNRAGTCGDQKDKCGVYPHQDLIKPDIEDPEAFLVFTPSGAVRARANLTPEAHHRATETIRILALDGALNQIRRAEVAGYIQTAEVFFELAHNLPEEEWLPELLQEIQNTVHLPFATAIKHVLTRQSD
ncbi:TPA: retron Ec78 anti-phage system effector HNH endonuclease PtuB [Pseudomonas aeruginosa]